MDEETDRRDEPAWLAPHRSTSELMLELAQLEYAIRAWQRRGAWGSAGQATEAFQSMVQRKDAVLQALHGAGLDFSEVLPEPPSMQSLGGRGPAAGTDLTASPANRAALAQQVEHLEQALATRTMIGQAVGILMERHRVVADEAFEMLRTTSSVTNRKLRDVAADLVAHDQRADEG